MKPKRILLIRHGKSEGNADKNLYDTIPDFALKLTKEGIEQAKQAGQEIKQIIGRETLHAYVSPYHRTRQTYQYIQAYIQENVIKAFEDPRLREQDWGHLRPPNLNDEIIQARNGFSTFYYRIPDGESGADVYDRVSTFLETMHRDFQQADYPENVLIVTHGMTLRLFLMRWFHWSVEEFESLCNPHNCQIVIMQKRCKRTICFTERVSAQAVNFTDTHARGKTAITNTSSTCRQPGVCSSSFPAHPQV